MPTTFHLRVWTRFLAPVEAVWAQKTDPAAIQAEFAPWASFRLADVDGLKRALAGEVPASLKATFRPAGFPIGFDWPITIDQCVPGERFRDRSVNRLYSRFEHEHVIESTPDGCRWIDILTFVPTAPLQKLAAIATRRMFIHRHAVAARRLPSDPQATGIGMLRVLVEAEEPVG